MGTGDRDEEWRHDKVMGRGEIIDVAPLGEPTVWYHHDG
jgi:hypothetical protein